MKRKWTEEEIQYVIENANKLTWSEMSKFLGCSIETVQRCAKNQGIEVIPTKSETWTKEEVELLREYSTKYITKTIAKKLNRSTNSVKKKALKEGIKLHFKNDIWKKWMIDYLKDNINDKSIRQIALFLNITDHQVRKKCKELGISYDNNRWTKEEENILREYSDKCHYSEITKLIPDKTKGAILSKARQMNIKLITEYKNLNEEELDYLISNWNKIPINEMARQLKIPRATIYRYKKKLNLSDVGQTKKWTEETLEELRKYSQTESIDKLAKRFKTSKSAISSVASKYDIVLLDGKRRWTDEKIDEIRKLAKNNTLNEISTKLNISPQTLSRVLKNYNIKLIKDTSKNLTEEEINLLKEMNNFTIPDIMKKIDKTDQTIISKCNELGIKYIPFPRKKWTEEELNNLIEDSKTLNIKELVIKYNRSSLSIHAKLDKLNIKLNTLVDHWSKEELIKLKDLIEEGKSINYIATIINRSPTAIEEKARKEKIIIAPRKLWTPEEEELLKKLWDEYNIIYIAQKLDRTISSIKNKAYELKLGRQFLNQDSLTIEEIVEVFKVSRVEVDTTWMSLGLPVKVQKISSVSSYKYVRIEDLFKFLEVNQFLYDGSNFEENILGLEPEWVKEKRKHDIFYGFDYERSGFIKKKLLQENKYYLDENNE